ATLGCHIAHHGVLALAAAAILCRFEDASSLLEASKASPSQEREEGQNHDAQYPEAMSLTLFHRILSIHLSSPGVPVNPSCFHDGEGEREHAVDRGSCSLRCLRYGKVSPRASHRQAGATG